MRRLALAGGHNLVFDHSMPLAICAKHSMLRVSTPNSEPATLPAPLSASTITWNPCQKIAAAFGNPVQRCMAPLTSCWLCLAEVKLKSAPLPQTLSQARMHGPAAGSLLSALLHSNVHLCAFPQPVSAVHPCRPCMQSPVFVCLSCIAPCTGGPQYSSCPPLLTSPFLLSSLCATR